MHMDLYLNVQIKAAISPTVLALTFYLFVLILAFVLNLLLIADMCHVESDTRVNFHSCPMPLPQKYSCAVTSGSYQSTVAGHACPVMVRWLQQGGYIIMSASDFFFPMTYNLN